MYLSILGGALYGVLVALPLVCTVRSLFLLFLLTSANLSRRVVVRRNRRFTLLLHFSRTRTRRLDQFRSMEETSRYLDRTSSIASREPRFLSHRDSDCTVTSSLGSQCCRSSFGNLNLAFLDFDFPR